MFGSLKTISALPGRIRWQASALSDNLAAARRIETELSALEGALEVRANPVTGRILVRFEGSLAVEAIEQCLCKALGIVDVTARRPKSLLPSFLTMTAVAVGLTSILGFAGSLAVGTLAAAGWIAAGRVRERLATNGIPSKFDLGSLATSLAPYRTRLLWAMAMDLGAGILAVSRFFFLGMAINSAYYGAAVQIGSLVVGAASATVVALVGILASIALRTWLKHRADLAWGYATAELQHDLRMRIYDHLQQLELDTILDRGREQLLRIASDDVNQVEKALSGVWNLVDIATYTLAMVAGILFISPQATWLVLVPLPIIATMSLVLGPKARSSYRKLRKEVGHLTSELRQGIDGVATIKSFTAEEQERLRIEAKSRAYEEISKKAALAASSFPILLELLVLSSTSAIYVLSVTISAGVVGSLSILITLNQLVAHAIYNLTRIGPHVETVERGVASFDRIRQLLEIEKPREEAAVLNLRHPVRGEIEYKEVCFSYPGSGPVFERLSLHFAAGSTTAVVGLSGSGKSTLIHLLLRFYDPDAGSIELDGIAINRISRRALRRQIALVGQDIFLFDRSIAENIRLGSPDATDEEVIEAARLAQADAFIRKLHNGYSTVLGEHGQNMSGGERQRIAIARALLKNAPIVVLDEPTSHLDAYTEGKFLDDLLPITKNRTMVLITHRLAIAHCADYIYNLDNGTIHIEGTHRELAAAGSVRG